MRIFCIFVEQLYSFHLPGEEYNEFERLFDYWHDPEFLEEFFTSHRNDLQRGFFGQLSVEDAVLHTRTEARKFEQRILQLSIAPEKLDNLFRPLSEGESVFSSPSKAYGGGHRNWLRIYALKIQPGVYAVTGGAIKLTSGMNEREHTLAELRKMQRCRDFLHENGISDMEGFKEMSSD